MHNERSSLTSRQEINLDGLTCWNQSINQSINQSPFMRSIDMRSINMRSINTCVLDIKISISMRLTRKDLFRYIMIPSDLKWTWRSTLHDSFWEPTSNQYDCDPKIQKFQHNTKGNQVEKIDGNKNCQLKTVLKWTINDSIYRISMSGGCGTDDMKTGQLKNVSLRRSLARRSQFGRQETVSLNRSTLVNYEKEDKQRKQKRWNESKKNACVNFPNKLQQGQEWKYFFDTGISIFDFRSPKNDGRSWNR